MEPAVSRSESKLGVNPEPGREENALFLFLDCILNYP